MNIGDLCKKPVVSVDFDDSIMAASALMREHHIGDVIVTKEKKGRELPVGILTDRDIVVSLAARDVDLDEVLVGDVMTTGLILARDDDSIEEVVHNMTDNGIRRMPVTNREGNLVGLISFDDLVKFFAEQLSLLSSLVDVEITREMRERG
jgi:CBS domain-containing protein